MKFDVFHYLCFKKAIALFILFEKILAPKRFEFLVDFLTETKAFFMKKRPRNPTKTFYHTKSLLSFHI